MLEARKKFFGVVAEIDPPGTGEGVEGKQLAKNERDPLNRFDTIHVCNRQDARIHVCNRQDARMRHSEGLKNKTKCYITTHVVVNMSNDDKLAIPKNR